MLQNRMKIRISHVLLLVASLLLALTSRGYAAQPNILLIVSDDQGYADLGVLNSQILTPHLDRLCREGSRLSNFYVAWPACTPSRAALLTGRYPQRNGIYDMIRNEAPDYGYQYPATKYAVSWERIGGMDEREVILPKMLQPAGYRSAIFGKWDLGIHRRYLPTSRGFDEFYGLVNTGIDYYTHERYGVPSLYRNESLTEEDKGTYCTYLFEREALRFLGEHAGKDPFFLYVPFNAPHSSSALDPKIRGTVQAPPEFEQLYPPVAKEFQAGNKYGKDTLVPTPEKRLRDYRAAVTCMDASIGKMLDLLDEKGIADNTIVIFFSDNGGSGGADNAPLRGCKGELWEGGVRVPAVVRWTGGKVPAGVVNDGFLSSLELFPSLAAASGASLPEGVVLDGYDWWPALRGEAPSPRTTMFWQKQEWRGVRVNQWKWVDTGKGGGLFELSQDVGETTDLSESHPEILRDLKRQYEAWYEETMIQAEPRGPFKDF